jgi:hypothetical protein
LKKVQIHIAPMANLHNAAFTSGWQCRKRQHDKS